MKILGISGSPRGSASRTLRLVQAALQGAEERGAETECIDLWMYDLQYCIGCLLCHRMGECVHKDDFLEIQQMLEGSDGIVLGSPVYIDNVTGMMKTLFDRLADAIHCQLLTGKYGCSVSTTHSSGGAEVVTYMNHVLNWLGVTVVGGVWAAYGKDPGALERGEEEAWALGRTLAEAIQGKRRSPDQETLLAEIREDFRTIVVEGKEQFPYDYYYWKERGWL